MRSKTAVIAVALLVAAVAARTLEAPRETDTQQTADAVRQFVDPAASQRLRDRRASRDWSEAGWFATFAALAAVAVGAEVVTRVTANTKPVRGS